jgi:hypothetical protein
LTLGQEEMHVCVTKSPNSPRGHFCIQLVVEFKPKLKGIEGHLETQYFETLSDQEMPGQALEATHCLVPFSAYVFSGQTRTQRFVEGSPYVCSETVGQTETHLRVRLSANPTKQV